MISSRYLYTLVHGRKPPRRNGSGSPRRGNGRHRGPARDYRYRMWIRSLPCICCGSTYAVEAAHTGDDGGMSQKASDSSVVPLCASCHRLGPGAYHSIGRAEFERRNHIDFVAVIRELNLVWSNREWLKN